MSSKSLSHELISLIISQLCGPTIFNRITGSYESEPVSMYSTVSKEWQTRIEQHTFSSLHLTPSRLVHFGRYVVGPRRAFVRSIHLNVVLETYDDEACGRFETEDEQHRNSIIFTQTFQSLFGLMHSWTIGEVFDQGIALSVKAYSPSDLDYCGQEKRTARLQRRRRGVRDILDRRFERSYLRFVLTDEEKTRRSEILPDVLAFTKLQCRHGHSRFMWPASCSEIVTSLSRLQNFDSYLWDNDRRVQIRKNARNLRADGGPWIKGFAASLANWPASVKEFTLQFHNYPPKDETYSPACLLETSSEEDILSTHLRRFSQQLTEIHLEQIVVSPEIFWPLQLTPSPVEAPNWPNLTSFYMEYIPTTPSGNWLLERDPAVEEDERTMESPRYLSDADEDDIPLPQDRKLILFRTMASADLINDLYVAAGRAALHMPCLRDMYLGAISRAVIECHWFMYQATATTAVATWGSEPRFEPSGQVLQLWTEVARKFTAAELEVVIQGR